MVSDSRQEHQDERCAERKKKDTTNLLQFHQGLLLNTIFFKVILRSVDNLLDDLLVDLASDGVRHDSSYFQTELCCLHTGGL